MAGGAGWLGAVVAAAPGACGAGEGKLRLAQRKKWVLGLRRRAGAVLQGEQN